MPVFISMLDGIIERHRRHAIDAILQHYRRHYLPHLLLLPSARFGLYAAAKEMLSPGDCVLISPVTCRTVIDALLAAGVRPVFVDIELASGNIDIRKLTPALLGSARAIVTTNLYGNPDCAPELKRMAERRGLLLIEDCAHVLSTSIEGRPVGGIGDVSVFSFQKYFGERGGIVTVRNEGAARRMQARLMAETAAPAVPEERARYLQLMLERSATSQVARALSTVYRGLGGKGRRPAAPVKRCDSGRQRLPLTATLVRVAAHLSRRDALVAQRMAEAWRLSTECPLEPKTTPYRAEVCPMAVPFSSARRDEIVARLKERGIATYFLYTPPMSRLFADLASANRVDADAVDHWCRTILPIDLRHRRAALEAVRSLF